MSSTGLRTCPVSSVVEVDPEGPRLVLPLPRHGGTVLVVGVGVVVVDVPEGKKNHTRFKMYRADVDNVVSDGGPSYFPVSMLERDGQHMGVVTKAFEKEVPPSSMMRRVLFIACMEPADEDSLHTGPGPVSLSR